MGAAQYLVVMALVAGCYIIMITLAIHRIAITDLEPNLE